MGGRGGGERGQEHGEERARWLAVCRCPRSRAAAVVGGAFHRSSVAVLLCGVVRRAGEQERGAHRPPQPLCHFIATAAAAVK